MLCALRVGFKVIIKLVSGGVTGVCCCGRSHPEMNEVAAAGVCCCGRGPCPSRW
jgi:hypothetical protein